MEFFWATLFVLGNVAVVTTIAIFSTTIYLHRALTHESLRILSKPLEMYFCVSIWITTGINRLQWVGVHSKHHKHTDEEGDPHSPLLLGFWKVQLFNVYFYVREAKNPDVVRRFAAHVSPWWGDKSSMRGLCGPVIGVFILVSFGLLFAFWRGFASPVPSGIGLGILAGFLHAFLYMFVLSPSINGLCHWRGVKRFPDTPAFNNRLLGWLVAGEGLHNNHHKYPRSPKFSIFRGDVDPAWPVINLLAKARLVVLRGKIGTPLFAAPQETALT